MMKSEPSREAILSRVRAAKIGSTEHPAVKKYSFPGDATDNFENMVEKFDGRVQRFDSRKDAISYLEDIIDQNRLTVFSSAEGYEGNIRLNDISDPHLANVVNVCVTEGILGVGETGSVWVTDESLGLTAAALFSTDLYILLDAKKIVDGIHQAYDHIDLRAHRYGAFYSGPSATADIEAVHITGAQGEISLTVLLYN